ncbi:MAG: hypothetical protein ACLT4E_14200 [Clostridium sp.]
MTNQHLPDPELTGEVLKVIKSLADLHIAMVIVTHEMAAKDISHRLSLWQAVSL